MMFYVCGSKNNPDVYGLHLVRIAHRAVLSSFKQSVTLPRAEGNPFLPERLCCHADPTSSGVWECVRFYDLMTPVGSDQGVGLSVASCELTSSYAKPGCDSSSGLVVGMEPHFWTLGRLRRAQTVRKCWIGGWWWWGCEDWNPQGTLGSIPREYSYTLWTLWHTGKR